MEYSTYYKDILYPTQDEVLRILKKCALPFYLTGGTAVSRGHFHHRYSDDLDFFVNKDSNFHENVDKAVTALEKNNFSIEFSNYASQDFTRIFLNKNKNGLNVNGLKIDFVNDIGVHFGDVEESEVYYRTDSLRNILSNKYTALYRMEVKDVVDICEISKHFKFKWNEIIEEANEKEGGLEQKEIFEIFTSFSDDDFRKIKWTSKPDIAGLRRNINIIAKDILEYNENSLCLE